MKSAVHRWLSNRWAFNTSNAYWRTLPMLSMGRSWPAAFISWCAVGFAIDLLLVKYQSLGRGFFWPFILARLGLPSLWPAWGTSGPCSPAIAGAGLWLAARISFHSSASPDLEAMHRRVVFDAIGMLLGSFVGYRVLVDFIRTEGLATIRIQTELAAFVFAPVAGQPDP